MYEINLCPLNLGCKFARLNYLLGSVKLTENVDPDNYFYSGHGSEFDTFETFSLSVGNGFDKIVVIFGVDNSSLMHGHNIRKDPTDGLDIKLTAEAVYYINFNKQQRSDSFLFVRVKINQLKAKDFTVENMKKTSIWIWRWFFTWFW